jgi:hypothetical protein
LRDVDAVTWSVSDSPTLHIGILVIVSDPTKNGSQMTAVASRSELPRLGGLEEFWYVELLYGSVQLPSHIDVAFGSQVALVTHEGLQCVLA